MPHESPRSRARSSSSSATSMAASMSPRCRCENPRMPTHHVRAARVAGLRQQRRRGLEVPSGGGVADEEPAPTEAAQGLATLPHRVAFVEQVGRLAQPRQRGPRSSGQQLAPALQPQRDGLPEPVARGPLAVLGLVEPGAGGFEVALQAGHHGQPGQHLAASLRVRVDREGGVLERLPRIVEAAEVDEGARVRDERLGAESPRSEVPRSSARRYQRSAS